MAANLESPDFLVNKYLTQKSENLHAKWAMKPARPLWHGKVA